jgi:hypothetical protein
MDSGKARDLFQKYAAAVAYLEVEDTNGDLHIGSSFHVGEGVFVTARHVLDGVTVTKIGSTEHTLIELTGKEAEEAEEFALDSNEVRPVHRVDNTEIEIASGPYFHPNDQVDVAIFKVREIDPYTPVIKLGSNLDNMLDRRGLVLTEAIVLGYPRVPKTPEPVLIGARAEVNAVIDRYDVPDIHFVLSSMPRGGFSGGIAISEHDIALGVVTSSLEINWQPPELGFMAVLGVEPIYTILSDRRLLPDCQLEGWTDSWNSRKLWFDKPDMETSDETSTIMASIELFNDGGRVALALTCIGQPVLLQELVDLASTHLTDYTILYYEPRPGLQRLDVYRPDNSAGQQVLIAARAVAAALVNRGYVAKIPGPPGGEDLLPLS